EFADVLAGLPPPSTPAAQRLYEAMLGRIAYHLRSPATPFRVAVVWVQRRAEEAKKGQAPPVAPVAPPPLTVGRPAPDFAEFDLAGRDSIRLSRWQGRPVLLIFNKPES